MKTTVPFLISVSTYTLYYFSSYETACCGTVSEAESATSCETGGTTLFNTILTLFYIKFRIKATQETMQQDKCSVHVAAQTYTRIYGTHVLSWHCFKLRCMTAFKE